MCLLAIASYIKKKKRNWKKEGKGLLGASSTSLVFKETDV
jgi:hypothetical protein